MIKVKPSRSYIGLDVGSRSIKVVELAPGNPPTLIKYSIVELPEGVIRGDEMEDKASIIRAIREAIDKVNPRTKEVIVSLSGHSVMKDRITVEIRPGEDIDKVIREETERRTPFDLAEVTFAHETLESRPAENQIDVLIVAARNDSLYSFLDLIYECGYEPVIVDVDSAALFNAFEHNYGGEIPQNEVDVILHIGNSISNLIFTIGGLKYHSSRDLLIAALDFKRYLEESGELDGIQIRNVMMNKKDSSISKALLEGPVAKAINGFVSELAMEVKKSFAFFKTNTEFETISKVYISGGGSLINNFINLFSEKIETPCVYFDPLVKIKFNENLFPSDRLKYSSQLPIAIGLALRGGK